VLGLSPSAFPWQGTGFVPPCGPTSHSTVTNTKQMLYTDLLWTDLRVRKSKGKISLVTIWAGNYCHIVKPQSLCPSRINSHCCFSEVRRKMVPCTQIPSNFGQQTQCGQWSFPLHTATLLYLGLPNPCCVWGSIQICSFAI